MIRMMIKKTKKTNQKLLAETMGINRKTLDSKFYRDSFEVSDLLKITDVLGLKIVFIDDEQQMIFDTSGNDVVIHPTEKLMRRKHISLKERLKDYKGDYKAEEWDTGEPVGREVF
jgi:antitoxin MazE